MLLCGPSIYKCYVDLIEFVQKQLVLVILKNLATLLPAYEDSSVSLTITRET